MMSLAFGLFTQVSGSGPLGPLVMLSDGIACSVLVHTLAGNFQKMRKWYYVDLDLFIPLPLFFLFFFFSLLIALNLHRKSLLHHDTNLKEVDLHFPTSNPTTSSEREAK